MKKEKNILTKTNIDKSLKKFKNKKIKEINQTFEYDKNILKGQEKDRINKSLSKYEYGIITKENYLEEVVLINKETLEKIDVVKEKKEKSIINLDNLVNSYTQNPTLDIVSDQSFLNSLNKYFKLFLRSLKNQTFLYILKRIGLSLITLILIVTFVTILIRFIPDTKFYDVDQYNKIKGASGFDIAENYKNVELFKVGRKTLDGKDINVFTNVFKYIYEILPIPKKVAITWESDYKTVKEYWTGLTYFGRSSVHNKYITEMISERMGISFKITIFSLFIVYLIGYPLGVAMSKKPGGIADKIGNVFIVLNYAIPALVFYLLMNQILGSPNSVFANFKFGFLYDEKNILTLFPPVFSLVFLSIPGVTIWVRRFMIDELNSDYVKFARSKGLSENRIMYTHILRNAIIPLIRNIPASFILAIVGSYYIENIWNIPGTGILLISSLNRQVPDIPVITGLTLIYAALGMLAFLLGDILTSFADPRIKLTKER